MKKLFFLFLIFLGIGNFLKSSEIREEDPLNTDRILRKSWISEVRDKEILDFHQLQMKFQESKSRKITKDKWGRVIRVNKNGKIEYLIQENYFQKFPHKDDLDLAYFEAESLRKARYNTESVRILQGILHCSHLQPSTNLPHSLVVQASQLLNSILKLKQDQSEIFLNSEPYGCYKEEDLYLFSDTFHYSIKIPSYLRYEFVWNPERTKMKTNQYIARYHRFYENLEPPKTLSWEEEYFLSELGESQFRKEKAVFFLGALQEFQPVLNEDTFYKVWDSIRGIHPSTKREWGYRRKAKEPGYETNFRIQNEKGDPVPWVVREYYYFRDGTGIFLSFSYPKRESESKEKDWVSLVRSLRVRR